MKTRFPLRVLLCLFLLLSLLPGAAIADGEESEAVKYIVVNIPYDVFYKQVVGVENTADIDAVTSATEKKSANFWSNPYEKGGTYYAPVAFGNFTDGIQGVMFPVKLSATDYEKLEADGYSGETGYSWADYDSWVSWARGETEADFGFSPVPAVYCDGAVDESGNFAFSRIDIPPTSISAAAQVSVFSKHGQYYVSLDKQAMADVIGSAQIYGAVIRTPDQDYALRHLKNLYYKDFNDFTVNTTAASTGKGQTFSASELAYFADLEGKTISEVDYYTNTGVYQVSTSAELADNSAYVLMNIPYHDFYEAELGKDDNIDAVTSATIGKARNTNVALGSYHSDGSSPIGGVIYPALVENLDILEQLGGEHLTEDAALSYTFSARGTPVEVNLKGKDALFEAPDYSWYALSETPAFYKTLTVSDGKAKFSALQGQPSTVAGVTAEVKVPEGHTDIGLVLSGTEGISRDNPVSAVVMTDSGGAKYALHHVVNIWTLTQQGQPQLGWNLADLDLGGKAIQNIRFYMKDAVIDYPVDISIPNAGYVLMNIPYAEFYAGELGDAGSVDAVTTATLKYENSGVAAGSYHETDAETDEESSVAGATYPVFAADLSKLDSALQVTDETVKTIHVVSGREKTLETRDVSGEGVLFCAPSHSWYVLSEKPARYKTLSFTEDGGYVFSSVSGRASTVAGVAGSSSYYTHHGNFVEIRLSKTGEDGEAVKLLPDDAIVGGIIVTLSGGENETKIALPHVQGIWSRTQIGWPAPDAVAGKTVTNVRFLTRDAVMDCATDIPILLPAPEGTEVNASFSSDNASVTVGGIPAAFENPRVAVFVTVNRQTTYLNAAGAAGDSPDENGTVGVTGAEDGVPYEVTVYSDNYVPVSVTANASGDRKYPVTVTNAPEGLEGLKEDGYVEGEWVTLKVPSEIQDEGSFTTWAVLMPESLVIENLTSPEITFQMPAGPVELEATYGGCYVATAVYGSYDCPEVWTLRRFRDRILGKTWYGRLFIRLYYAVSPTAVKLFGNSALFQRFFRGILDRMVFNLQAEGFASTPYSDRTW